MKAEDKPLTDEGRRERERAREVGRRMAKDTIKKLKPQIKAMADVINEANDRIYEDGRKAGIREVVEWIRDNFTDGYSPAMTGEPEEFIYIETKPMDIKWQAQKKKWGINEADKDTTNKP